MNRLLTFTLLTSIVFCSINSTAQPVTKTKPKKDNTKGKATAPTGKQNTNKQASFNMQGAYAMLRQVANDGTKDSLLRNQQLKIYTDRYMIYAHPAADDSLADYGIGTYEIKNGKVMEYIFHTASGGAQKDTFELSIKKTADGYSQVFVVPEYQGKRWRVTEDYKSVSKNVTTPLDGAWKQTKAVYIPKEGSTITNNNPT
ncbi:MAG: hypothetical protein M3342_23945, partial [Bacteroidota bacterium]|nr:hypothetical protein [Bacteroidota bacterium]